MFTLNIFSFWGTVCVHRPTLKKDTDQNVLPEFSSTMAPRLLHTPSREDRRFLYFKVYYAYVDKL